MLKILSILFCLMFFNTAHAEITQSVNTFDNAKIISSHHKNKDLRVGRNTIFKRYNNEFYLLLNNVNKITDLACTLEPSRIKIDNSISTIYITTYDVDYRQHISIHLTKSLIEQLKNANNVEIQFAEFSDDEMFVDYFTVQIPQYALEEWKQVINMN